MSLIPWGNVWLPMVPLPTVLLAGLRGAGKTLFLRLMMQAILSHSKTRSFVYDPKRELCQYIPAITRRKIHILDPTDRDSSAWDIAADFPNYGDAPALADLFVRRREKVTDAGEFFQNAEKTIMSGIIRGLQRRAPGRWTLRDIILTALDKSLVRQMMMEDCLARAAMEDLQNATEAGQNVWLSFRISLTKFDAIAALWHNAKTKFSIERDWMDSPSICLLGVSQKDPNTFAPFNQTFFRRLKECLLGQPEHPDLSSCVVLDELPTLGNVSDEVGELIRVGRSKHVGVLNAFQDINTLYEKFTENGAKSLLSNFTELAIFCCQMETANWAAEIFGKSRWRRWTESHDPDPPGRYANGAPFSPQFPKSTYQEYFEEEYLVQPTAFTDIPKPSKADGIGLLGYLRSSHYGRMKLSISSQELSRRLVMPLPGTREPFVPRNPSDYELKDWLEWERRNLNLEPAESGPNQSARRHTTKRRPRHRRPTQRIDLRDFY